MIKNKELKRRIIEISRKYNLAHLGSCLTAVDIIDEIYSIKKPDEKFVLSSGHAGLALYCVLEKYDVPKDLGDGVLDFKRMLDAEKIWLHHGTHPDRCGDCRLDCSTGSLGHGLPIAVGMALAEKQNFNNQIQDSCPTRECEHQRVRNVYCLISDGECAEGSIWEALRIAGEQYLGNLMVFANINGYGAYKEIKAESGLHSDLEKYLVMPRYTDTSDFPFLKGLDAHYHVMNDEEYKQALEILT